MTHDDELVRSVKRRRRRRDRWRREGERSFLRSLSLIGAIGWLVVTPTILGMFLGRLLDRRLSMGVFWSATLLCAGAALGCWLAWRQVVKS